MSLKILDEKIKNKNILGAYLFYGEEHYDINKYIEKIKKCFDKLELGVNLFVLDKNSVDMLNEMCDAISFFGSEKLIIIKDTGLKFNVELLSDLNEDTTIIVVENSVDKRISEYKYLNKHIMCIEFNKLKDKDAVMYIMKTLKAYNINIDNISAEYMAVCCTTDKYLLINEFKKITSYLKPGDTLTRELIDKICVKTLNSKVFDMLDLAIAKKHDKAVNMLKELFEQKESAIGISIMLFKQIKQMYMIKLCAKEENSNEAIKELGIHPFVLGKLKDACKNYTIEELEILLKEFSEYDEKSKIGEMDQENGLIRIIMMM